MGKQTKKQVVSPHPWRIEERGDEVNRTAFVVDYYVIVDKKGKIVCRLGLNKKNARLIVECVNAYLSNDEDGD